jgi:D-amino-acid dehydrogenase
VSLEPALASVASELAGAIHYPDDEGGDAFLFCREMTRVCRELGVQFRFGESITPATLKGQCPWTVQLDSEALKVEAVLITAGADSQRLLAPLGVALPVRPVKGYSITVPRPLAVVAPTVPVADSDLHIAFVPIGAHRLRMVGTAEFAGHDLSLNERRLGYLRAQAERLYPEVLRAIPSDSFTPWTGLRPMSVDGVPLIGSTRIEGLFLCTGHGHLGWTLAAASGEHIALQMLGLPTTLDASAYAPTRFAALA